MVILFLAVEVIGGKEGGVAVIVVGLDGSDGIAVVLNILGFGLIVVVMNFGAAVGIVVIGGNVISLDGDCDGGRVVGIYEA